ncbi:MAG: hypothetical protein RL434_1347, partial [Pseudomonadota bacterium]
MTDPLVRDPYAAPPAEEEATRPARERTAPTALYQRLSPGLVLALLGGLGGVALLVIFALPAWVDAPTPIAAQDSKATHAADSPPRDTADSRLLPEPAGAREAAQEALVALMDDLDALRARRVAEWDAAGLVSIENLRAEGEEAYRARRYTAARRKYQAARQRMSEVSAQLPRIIEDLIDQGEQALRSGEAGAAEQAFSRVLGWDPDNSKARLGQQRARNRDRVLALLGEAQGYERMGESLRAERAWQSALELDPQAAEARQGLARLTRMRAEEAFASRMSEGYAALEKGQFERARSGFEAAAKLRPEAPEAPNALAHTKARATAARLDAALAAAARATRTEDWAGVERHYREALAIDATLPAAREGAAAARRRATLDQRLGASLRAPARLADRGVQREVEVLLREARTTHPSGQRLRQQISALEAALAAARTPVRIELRSDGMTEVMLVGSGGLGQFSRHEITLSPGRYTAVGSRPGYHETRVEFVVEATGP